MAVYRSFGVLLVLTASSVPPLGAKGGRWGRKKGCKQEELEFIALSPRVKWPPGNAETDQNARADCLPLLVFLVV